MSSKQATTPGTLFIVATPIGNKNDISERALTTLKSVDFILAEDTRHSSPLLAQFGIKKDLKSYHAFNENTLNLSIIKALQQGQSAALISDAGTPLISDPGYPLVKIARENQISVVPIPGPCALITALSAAGIPCDKFTFLGFLPAKQEARKQALLEAKKIPHTLVFYESTHRIIPSLEDIESIFGDECQVVIAKELTKVFEQFAAGTINELLAWFQEDPARQKGEFVVLLPPRSEDVSSDKLHFLLDTLLAELPLKQAVKLASKISGLNKNLVYEQALVRQKS